MVEIGKINNLQIVKSLEHGIYLDGEELGEILMPSRYVPENCEVGNSLDVFIYLDSADLLIATTETPYVMVDECAYLKVVDVNPAGAFLDWGLPKDLLVPYGEQISPLKIGQSYTVLAYLDENTNRIAATQKLDSHLSEEAQYFKPEQAVDLLIFGKTELGYKAVINNTHIGLIYKNEVFQTLSHGEKLKGFIKTIREDRKIDLCLQLSGKDARDDLNTRILNHLRKNDGESTLTDKSSPDDIYQCFSVSKKNYKKAIGMLYKKRLIRIEEDKITLL
ncbi:MAG: S1-like domain-containing RNA-binding protein [Gammaproteobacteria bacterium]